MKLEFLNGPLGEEVYGTKPPGFVKEEKENIVYRLHKALYNLKHAPRAWYKKIDSYMVELGFIKYRYEYGVYVQSKGGDITIICLFFDDFLVKGNNIKGLDKFK